MDHATTHAAQPANDAPVWSEWYGENTKQVIAFFGQLKRIPIATWNRSAQADPHVGARERDGAPPDAVTTLLDEQADQEARARLRDAMEAMPGVVRRIRRRIDQEMTILDGIAPTETVTRMRRVARLAACAIAARPLLPPEDFARLYRPFVELIPLDRLQPR